MTASSLVAVVLLLGVALTFLVGVRLVFRRPRRRHGYRASLVSAAVFLTEAIAISLADVTPRRLAAAMTLLCAALALFGWAAAANRARPLPLAFAGEVPDELQTRGPHAFIRHPFYTSYLLAFFGGLVASGTPWVAPVVAVAVVMYWDAARREEQLLVSSALGARYRAYARQVGMFVPLSLRRPPAAAAAEELP